MPEILGVVKLVPVPNEVPPVEAVYQLIIPPIQPPAFSVIVPVPHLLPGVLVGAAGAVVTVATTLVLETEVQEPTVQPT